MIVSVWAAETGIGSEMALHAVRLTLPLSTFEWRINVKCDMSRFLYHDVTLPQELTKYHLLQLGNAAKSAVVANTL